MLRTHTCGELTKENEGKTVEIAGWNNSSRNHGGIIFVDVRDRYGITQVVFDPQSKEIHSKAEKLSREDCIRVKGKVRARNEGMENPNMKTGAVEILAEELEILGKSDVLPMDMDDINNVTDETRLKYRYLDLRRDEMQKNLQLRSDALQAARKYLTSNNFVELETPLLVKSTPEGARDYVVPSRVNKNKFYALPQSPQLYKQLLMVSGFDRYFQIARCLRDEDLRQDRQPEHTQIDLEMSFVEVPDLHRTFEGLFKAIFEECLGVKVETPFPTFSYDEVMDKYGIDKPDIRFDLFLKNISSIVEKSEFSVFSGAVSSGGIVKCLSAPKNFSRKEIEELEKEAKQLGAKGLAWTKVASGKLDSGIAKFLSPEIQQEIIKITESSDDSTIFFVADKENVVNDSLARVRVKVAEQLGLIDNSKFNFLWVTGYPLFERNEEENRWEPMHHMFCMPKAEDVDKLEKDPGNVYCTQYDLVLNGVELGSGSIRITDPEIQKRVMKVIGMSDEEANKKFGFLLRSFKYGAPPHGGIGLGFDRIISLMLGHSDIREVIAFPKNKNAQCPMDESPSDIDEKQLDELNIKLK